MKAAGIFRGFPGLGRVVAGIEVLQELKQALQAEIAVFTYLQGYDYAQRSGIPVRDSVHISDVSSIGIIPVSPGGERIIEAIRDFQPDLVIIDGEPLLLTTLRLCFPKLRIITLLNPFDVNNPHNRPSSQLFFRDCYSKADVAIVHGLWTETRPAAFNNQFHSINTIIRKEVREVIFEPSPEKIVCILGGGTTNSSKTFFENTINIAKKSCSIASFYQDLSVEVLCGSKQVYEEVKKLPNVPPNITVTRNLKSPAEVYSGAKLVIARAGRNTISELLHLNIPAILFPTSCNIRGSEQEANLNYTQQLTGGYIVGKYLHSDTAEIIKSVEVLRSGQPAKFHWKSGDIELNSIL